MALSSLFGDEADVYERADEVLRSGGWVVAAFTDDDTTKKEHAARIFKAHSSQEVLYWWEWALESLVIRGPKMNWCEIQEDWEQFRIVLKTYWTRLTDEDLAVIDGDRAALASALEQRYGLAKEEVVEQAIAAFEEDVRRPGAVK